MEEKNVLSIHFSSIISLTQLLQPIKLYLSIKIYTLIVSVKKNAEPIGSRFYERQNWKI